MAKESKNGLMVLIMRAIGEMEFCKEKEYSTILMGTNTRVPSSRIEQTDSELTFTKMVKLTRAIGRMICIMVKAKRNNQMALLTKACSMRASEQGMVFTDRQKTILCTKATGTTI
jgi:hypothetical protein